MLGLLAGLGLGVGKALSDMFSRKREQTLAAETQRYSPWTGLRAQPVKWENPVQDIAGGALSGAAMQQSFDRNDALNSILNKMLEGSKDPEIAINAFANREPLDADVWSTLGRKGKATPYNLPNGFALS